MQNTEEKGEAVKRFPASSVLENICWLAINVSSIFTASAHLTDYSAVRFLGPMQPLSDAKL
jgi:hypothetical protein